MFDNFVNLFTAAAMLVHSVLGCCSHHTHACSHGLQTEDHLSECREDSDATAKGSPHQGCCHHDFEPQDAPLADRARIDSLATGEQPSDGCPHEPCDHVCERQNCVFASQFEKVEVPSIDSASPGCSLTNRPALKLTACCFATNRTVEAGPAGWPACGRYRIVTQTWLI